MKGQNQWNKNFPIRKKTFADKDKNRKRKPGASKQAL